ncbi:MAG: DNA repair protein RadA [Trueperaceae bacterium]|nr:DNA repair protein RadA [Trueperaceae bacterium]
MPKAVSDHVCDACGARSATPMGRCPSCGAWGSMRPAPRPGRSGAGGTHDRRPVEVRTLNEVEDAAAHRVSSGVAEVDRVLGGGWVHGAALLLAGEPGIGKSTLLLQLAHHAHLAGRRTLYVAGEESASQIKARADRLGLGHGLSLTRETHAPTLGDHLLADAPDLAIVDSIQTLRLSEDAAPGSVTQVRDGTAVLARAAKECGTTLVAIGHVTKQGSFAGPKVVEHMVDATLALESAAGYRVLRALKNRFGPAGEVGVFEMRNEGLTAVANPSAAFLAERPKGVPGSVVVAALEGQRPLLLEVQALASKSPYASPKRVVQGLDARRVDVVLAVLERRLELPLGGLDVFVNVAGGLRLTDPGADLAVALAVWSAVTNRPLPEGTAVVGEVGLAGEIRGVAQLPRRVAEAQRVGFDTVIGPRHADLPGGGSPDLAAAIRRAHGPVPAGTS